MREQNTANNVDFLHTPSRLADCQLLLEASRIFSFGRFPSLFFDKDLFFEILHLAQHNVFFFDFLFFFGGLCVKKMYERFSLFPVKFANKHQIYCRRD